MPDRRIGDRREEDFVRKIISKEAVFVLATVSVVIGVVNFITIPQRANSEQIEYLKGVIDKNQAITATLTKSQQNDLHTLEGRMDQQRVAMDQLTNEVTKLSTIIDERIPQKKAK